MAKYSKKLSGIASWWEDLVHEAEMGMYKGQGKNDAQSIPENYV